MTETIIDNRPTRQEHIATLRQRDGDNCMHPKCGKPLDFSINYNTLEQSDSRRKMEPTIDHWMPQYWCKNNHWTNDEIWDTSNLKLMHKACNASKGDLIPNDDGSLPEKAVRKFRYRRDKRAGRPELCMECDNGHNLTIGEICASCGCDAQRYPREAKVRYNDCDHEIMWCWVCSITPEMRTPAFESALRHGTSGEDGFEE